MADKYERVEEFIAKLKKIANKSVGSGDYDKAMAAIASAGWILYQYNQTYTDDELENLIDLISSKMGNKYYEILSRMHSDSNTVLFYDGFGMDTRGVAIMYLKALSKGGYRIIYVTDSYAEKKQPQIHKQMKNANIVWKYIPMHKNYCLWVDSLIKIIAQYSPKAMLFYTLPNDVAGAVSFSMCQGKIERFLIDLTDHAFWLGTHSNDFFFGSREMSASNQYYRRGIPKEKLIKLGVNLVVEEETNHEGLPFEVTKERYIFSGGSLYKTMGDPNNTFYMIIGHILEQFDDIKFLYAGQGDNSQMSLLMNKFPGRVFLIAERKDFYYFIQNCTLYLNTYPMFGGMMMKYSANAGKIPVTLRHNADSDGLLLDQKNAKIEYDSYEELIQDVDRLLSNEEYLQERESLLDGTIISEERFCNNLKSAIENHSTDYSHEFIELDTSKFQQEFYERFDLQAEKEALANSTNSSLFPSMPWMYVYAIKRLYKKVVRKFKR